ncbi:ig-like domain-containing surface protein [Firmicutes bacterium CAG:552]|nr:ig-like domain-containing surface protein [Firmicutes bacterium CAG:552]
MGKKCLGLKVVISILFVMVAFATVGCNDADLPQMEAPSGLSIFSERLSWIGVSGAKGYVVKIAKGKEETSVNVSSTSYDLSEIKSDGAFTLSVSAVGDGKEYSDSPFSDSVTYYCGNKTLRSLKYEEAEGGYKILGYVDGVDLPLLYIPSYIERKPVVSIAKRAFNASKALTAVYVPSTVKDIGDRAFFGCNNLDRVSIQGGNLKIGAHAFASCRSLKRVVFNGAAAELGDYAFRGCSNIAIYYTQNVTAIGECAFLGSGLSGELDLRGVKNIKSGAFNGCEITSITFGKNLSEIGPSAFFNCDDLNEIKLSDENDEYVYVDGCLIRRSDNTLVLGLASAVIPETVVSIGDYAFAYRKNLSEIAIPSSVTAIGSYAFANCENLKTIEVSQSVKSIQSCVFKSCVSLTKATWRTLVSVPDSAFEGCSALTDVKLSNVAKIGKRAFSGCIGLKEIILPQSLTEIGEYAFNKTALASITLPQSIDKVGNGWFSDCKYLETVNFDGKIKEIGNSAFSSCISLKNIEIPSSVVSIGNSAFNSCTSLKNIEIPSSVVSIGKFAFIGCSALSEVLFNEGLKTIGESAFHSCKSLSSVQWPLSLEEIGASAFAHTSFPEIYVPKSIKQGSKVFARSYGTRSMLNSTGLGSFIDAFIPNSIDTLEYAALAWSHYKPVGMADIMDLYGLRDKDLFTKLTLYVADNEHIEEKWLDYFNMHKVNVIYGCELDADGAVYSVTASADGIVAPRPDEINAPRKHGYTFGGWVTYDDSGNIDKTYTEKEILSLPKGITVYANWIERR